MKTTWKYGTGKRSAMRASTHSLRAAPDTSGSGDCGRSYRRCGSCRTHRRHRRVPRAGCPAGFYRAHDASFGAAKMTGVLSPVGASMSSKDVGDFEGRAQPITIPAASPPAVTDRAG